MQGLRGLAGPRRAAELACRQECAPYGGRARPQGTPTSQKASGQRRLCCAGGNGCRCNVRPEIVRHAEQHGHPEPACREMSEVARRAGPDDAPGPGDAAGRPRKRRAPTFSGARRLLGRLWARRRDGPYVRRGGSPRRAHASAACLVNICRTGMRCLASELVPVVLDYMRAAPRPNDGKPCLRSRISTAAQVAGATK
jgi:hypothetical protein